MVGEIPENCLFIKAKETIKETNFNFLEKTRKFLFMKSLKFSDSGEAQGGGSFGKSAKSFILPSGRPQKGTVLRRKPA